MRHSNTLVPTLGLVVLLLALIWPAVYNGQPFYFPDTTAYLRGADAGFQKLTGVATPWSLTEDTTGPDSVAQAGDAAATPSVSSIKDKTVLSGRSVYYGALLYMGDRIGGFWLTIVVQAVVLLLAMVLFFRAVEAPLGLNFAITVIAVALTTSASFFVSFLMPDIFAATVILACASLIGAKRRLPWGDYTIWLLLLAAALTFHTSHVLIAGVMLVFALVYNTAKRSWGNWRGLAVIGVCLAVAFAAEALFGWAVRRAVGAAPLRPPFLMARLIEDGPGYRYLKESCPRSNFQVCNSLGRLPMNADKFIWSFDPPGVFAVSTPEIRRMLSAEQIRFAWAVVKYDPLGVVGAAAANAGLEFFSLGLAEFDMSAPTDRLLANKLPTQYRARFRASAAYKGSVPTRTWSGIGMIVFWSGLLSLVVILFTGRLRQRLHARQLDPALWVLAGVVINAVVCGTMSGPHDRYAARVAWLIPFVAIALLLEVARLRRGRPLMTESA
ncbi:MAG: hypothetical protein ACHQDB_02410 [Steroidobacterales bacterium]